MRGLEDNEETHSIQQWVLHKLAEARHEFEQGQLVLVQRVESLDTLLRDVERRTGVDLSAFAEPIEPQIVSAEAETLVPRIESLEKRQTYLAMDRSYWHNLRLGLYKVFNGPRLEDLAESDPYWERKKARSRKARAADEGGASQLEEMEEGGELEESDDPAPASLSTALADTKDENASNEFPSYAGSSSPWPAQSCGFPVYHS